MRTLLTGVIFFSVLLALHCNAEQDTINNEVIITKVDRTVDLSTHLPKITSVITVENGGKSGVRSFLYAIDPFLKDRLSYIGATVKGEEENQKLKVVQTNVANHKDKVIYRVELPGNLDVGKHITVDMEAVFSHSLKPYPSEITQGEKQYMLFRGSQYLYTPYKTTTQTTTVTCTSSTIESYTKTKPHDNKENSIIYGPFENKDAFTETVMEIHYENNSPFLTVTSMTRVIEVSHWGNIAVEETYDLLHTGANLKGPFSRYDYQRHQDGVSSVKAFKMVLPAAARDVYYRDEIGNISTSHLRESDDIVELELRPRFPLFGGWKTHYYIGYNVPSYQYLYNNGDQYLLKMHFVDHAFDDQVIDQLTIKIILPEGSKDIKFTAPYSVQRGADELHYTYLDTTGRPVIVAHKNNLVEQHIQDFGLGYKFQKLQLLQEPLMVVGAFYLLFVLVIIYVRMDFSITKDEASESRMRVAGLLEQVQSVQDRRSALYQSYEDAINKYKSSKDTQGFTANRKKIDTDHKTLTQQITGLLNKLKQEGSDAAEKVVELQKLDGTVKEQFGQAMQYAEKLVSGKMTKQQYIDFEAGLKTKRDEVNQKMENILSSIASL